MKKIICLVLAFVLSFGLVSCGGDDKEHGRDINTVTKEKDEAAPFKEGYYEGGEYVLRLVYTGNEAENSYDVYVYEGVNGTEVFMGIVFGVESGARKFTVPGYNNEETSIRLEKVKEGKKDVLKLENANSHPFCNVLEGEYEYFGKAWLSQAKAEEHNINPGLYKSEFYRLTVEEADGLTYFKISDASAVTLFSGKKKMNDDKSTAAFSLPDSGSALRFYKGSDNEGEFIEVVEIGNNIVGVDYVGKYYEVK